MIPLQKSGQLAQLVEHLLDVQGVRGSSPLLSTKTRESELRWVRILCFYSAIYKAAPNGQRARNSAVFCCFFI